MKQGQTLAEMAGVCFFVFQMERLSQHLKILYNKRGFMIRIQNRRQG